VSQNLQILVVDYDPGMARTLRDIFRVKGYEAEVAHSGPEALDRVRESGFDCVLTDIKTPGMDGARLFRSIREMQPQLPVVFMTAYSTGKVVQEALEEGAVGTLVKPLDIDLLLSLFSHLRKEGSRR